MLVYVDGWGEDDGLSRGVVKGQPSPSNQSQLGLDTLKAAGAGGGPKPKLGIKPKLGAQKLGAQKVPGGSNLDLKDFKEW